MSDLHGNYPAFIKMLELISFNSEDELFIVGDVIDRNEGGIRLLQYIKNATNIYLILGNHEDMMLTYYDTFSRLDLEMWYQNGGKTTHQQFEELNEIEKLEFLKWLRGLGTRTMVKFDDKSYVLGHAYPYCESANKDEILWHRIEPTDICPQHISNENIRFVCGHTPTIEFQNYKGRWEMLKSIDDLTYFIDTGAGYPEEKGASLCCMRLDDEQVYYVDANVECDESYIVNI